MLEGGTRKADEGRAHMRVRRRENHLDDAAIGLCSHQHVVGRNSHVVEVDLALVERALTEFVERLAARDTLKIERDERHPATLESLARIDRAEQDRDGGDASVRDPRGLLAADHVLIAFFGRDAVRTNVRVVEDGLIEGKRVTAMIWFRDGPAADFSTIRGGEAVDQLRFPCKVRKHGREAGDAECNRQA